MPPLGTRCLHIRGHIRTGSENSKNTNVDTSALHDTRLCIFGLFCLLMQFNHKQHNMII